MEKEIQKGEIDKINKKDKKKVLQTSSQHLYPKFHPDQIIQKTVQGLVPIAPKVGSVELTSSSTNNKKSDNSINEIENQTQIQKFLDQQIHEFLNNKKDLYKEKEEQKSQLPKTHISSNNPMALTTSNKKQHKLFQNKTKSLQ